jgi:hypothetical protein
MENRKLVDDVLAMARMISKSSATLSRFPYITISYNPERGTDLRYGMPYQDDSLLINKNNAGTIQLSVVKKKTFSVALDRTISTFDDPLLANLHPELKDMLVALKRKLDELSLSKSSQSAFYDMGAVA